MKYFVKDNRPPTRDYRELHQAIDEGLLAARAYREHLREVASRLPAETRSFALEPWYGDPQSHDCPHDGWLLQASFHASATEDRTLHGSLRVLGAYHDRILEFEYSRVVECQVNLSGLGQENVGAWLADEFDVLDNGLVAHEIQWQHGNPWRIVAAGVRLIVNEVPGARTEAENGTH